MTSKAEQSVADSGPLSGARDLGGAACFTLNRAGSVVAASETLAGTALLGGIAGTVQGAENGDGLGIAAGLLQAAAAASAGLATYAGGASDAFKSVIAGLGAASAGTSIADAAEQGGRRTRCSPASGRCSAPSPPPCSSPTPTRTQRRRLTRTAPPFAKAWMRLTVLT